MGLREVFQKAAQTALVAAGNIPVSCVYSSFASTTYNASAGTNTLAFTSIGGVSVIFEEFELVKIDGSNIQSGDKQALVPAKGAISTITPGVQDRIRESNGDVWDVIGKQIDPADALWQLHIRKR